MLHSENVRRFYRRLKGRLALYHNGSLGFDKMEHQLNAWQGHARQAETHSLRKSVFRKLRHRWGLNVVASPWTEGAWVVM